MFFLSILVVATEIGYRAGIRQRDKWSDAADGGGGLVLSAVFALLGLILAFTLASGVNHHKNRKQTMIAEANALGTAFLRAGVVDEPASTKLKIALLQYARSRVIKSGPPYTPKKVETLVHRSSLELAVLWPVMQQILQQKHPGPIEAALMTAVNNVIDLHTIRIVTVFEKLPPIVLVLMVFIASTALSVAGFNAGITGRISRWRMATLAMTLAAVVLVIQDFDRPLTGFVRINHDSIDSVITEMEADLSLSGNLPDSG